ncbi:MAG: nitroreductase [Clostridia bacterium]|nr:nitroreductase [Clostridia bacterium]
MTIREAIDARHSVRAYTKQPIEGEVLKALEDEIAACCKKSGLSIRLFRNDPSAIKGLWAYGAFENADNYIALAGPDTDDLFRLCGYWGEHLVLFAETLGLSTCWIAGSYKKNRVKKNLNEGEALAAIISIGYAAKPGKPHKSKTFAQVTDTAGDVPEWFKNGVEAALLAPTAINQQRFRFTLRDDKPFVKALPGPYTLIDLGIVQVHFEIGAGRPVEAE